MTPWECLIGMGKLCFITVIREGKISCVRASGNRNENL